MEDSVSLGWSSPSRDLGTASCEMSELRTLSSQGRDLEGEEERGRERERLIDFRRLWDKSAHLCAPSSLVVTIIQYSFVCVAVVCYCYAIREVPKELNDD